MISETDFREAFRFSKRGCWFVLNPPVDVEFRYKVSGEECLMILLRRLSYPSRYNMLTDVFGRSKAALSSIFNFGLEYIHEKCKHLLAFDWERLTPAHLERMCAMNREDYIPEDCVGFIDGTVRPICRPGRDQRAYYNGHKRIHLLKYQSIAFPDGMIVFADGPYTGNRHDTGLFRDSGLAGILEGHLWGVDGRQPQLYGDSAYPERPYLVCPYKGSALTSEQTMFNNKMSSLRISVEWSFGKVATLFAFGNYRQNVKVRLQPAGMYYLVATIFTNTSGVQSWNFVSPWMQLLAPY